MKTLRRHRTISGSSARLPARHACTVMLLCAVSECLWPLPKWVALAQTPAQKQTEAQTPSGKIGKGKREIQNKSCLVPVKARGLNEGDLAEVVDGSNSRIAVVRIERLPPQTGRLVANVLVGGEKCDALRGLSVRALTQWSPTLTGLIQKPQPTPLLSLSVQYAFAQSNIPGLAMNKFLTPAYTQRGIGLRAGGNFPRQAISTPLGKFKALGDVQWAASETSPPLDLVRDGKIAGTQSLSSQAVRVRAAAQYISKESKFWTNAGALLFDSLTTKSTLNAIAGASDPVFPVVRAINANGFGLFLEQGFVLPGEARMSLLGGVSLGMRATTPLLEDGDATNTSETFTFAGTPLLAGMQIKIPFNTFAFVDLHVDYRKMELQLPLVNDKVTKAQLENLSLATGLGLQF